MVYVYDVESFPNFFSVVLWNVNDLSDKKQYYIYKEHNDVQHIQNLFNENHWFVGYNSSDYDDLIIEKIIMAGERYRKISGAQVASEINDYSTFIIEDDRNRYSKNLFNSFDLMRIAGLYKTLKLVAVNLKHKKVQDLPYDHNHIVKDNQVGHVLEYNDNDTEITYKLYQDQRKKIKLRQDLSSKYSQNLMNYPDSGIANRILERDYEDFSGTPYAVFKNINTHRESVAFSECISDKITFESDHLKKFLENLKSEHANKSTKIEYRVKIGSTTYDILKGGIHSNMPPEIKESDDQYTIKDADVTSYYPNIMINGGFKPAHLHDCFLPLLKSYVTTRVKAKKEGNKTAADGLKIVINSIYGKMGNEYHFLYDIKSMYQVTLNGQLFLLMLIEMLENAGIHVFYANTDGVTAYVHNDQVDEYNRICKQWQEYTDFELEFDDYKKCIIRDVNNYIWIPFEGDIKYKGFFDINRYKDVTKGFDRPILPIAISKWFTEGIPVEYTIFEHDDILDFCMAQKASDKFDIYYDYIEMGYLVTEPQQKTNRYYVGKKGGSLYKQSDTQTISLVAGQPVHILNDVSNTNAKDYPIKYSYYIQEANKIINLFNNKQQDLFL